MRQRVEDPHVHELRVLTISPGHLKEFVQVSEKALPHKTKEGGRPATPSRARAHTTE
jgi:hypothetical protein